MESSSGGDYGEKNAWKDRKQNDKIRRNKERDRKKRNQRNKERKKYNRI